MIRTKQESVNNIIEAIAQETNKVYFRQFFVKNESEAVDLAEKVTGWSRMFNDWESMLTEFCRCFEVYGNKQHRNGAHEKNT